MKLAVAGFTILACAFMIAVVSGAMVPQADANGFSKRAQRREKAAIKYAAQGDPVAAARCYVRATSHYRSLAAIQKGLGDEEGAARYLLKATAMYKAATAQERMHLKRVLSALKQSGMHEGAATAVSWAASGHVPANRHHGSVAEAYVRAANLFTAAGDLDKALSMQETAAREYAVHGAQLARNGDREGAADHYSRAAEYYAIVGHCDRARDMNEAAAAQRKARARPPAVETNE